MSPETQNMERGRETNPKQNKGKEVKAANAGGWGWKKKRTKEGTITTNNNQMELADTQGGGRRRFPSKR